MLPWLSSAAKEMRFTWCTTCAAAGKCAKHPFVELNWKALREQLNGQVDLANPNSPAVQKLVSSLRALTLDLADVFPPLLRISESPVVARELLVQLRLLQSTIQVKLDQFGRGRGRFSNANPSSRVR